MRTTSNPERPSITLDRRVTSKIYSRVHLVSIWSFSAVSDSSHTVNHKGESCDGGGNVNLTEQRERRGYGTYSMYR
jgi:hypothetical protein